MSSKQSVLIVEDNPVHLELYRMIVEQAGFRGLPVLVSFNSLPLPADESVDAVLLDYKLGPHMTALDAVMKVKERYPDAPIVLLSDMYESPSDTAPHVEAFVSKGKPEDLISALRGVLKKTI